MNFNTNEYEKVTNVISGSTLQPTIICQLWQHIFKKYIYSQSYENVKMYLPFSPKWTRQNFLTII